MVIQLSCTFFSKQHLDLFTELFIVWMMHIICHRLIQISSQNSVFRGLMWILVSQTVLVFHFGLLHVKKTQKTQQKPVLKNSSSHFCKLAVHFFRVVFIKIFWFKNINCIKGQFSEKKIDVIVRKSSKPLICTQNPAGWSLLSDAKYGVISAKQRLEVG